jgi:CDP-glycerol glycerophosphotransferase
VWLADPRFEQHFPPGVETVRHDAAETVEVLDAADLVIANVHTPLPWRKRPGAFYLQTWHGTPLKRIHWDILWAPPGRIGHMSHDVAMWDLLLSPNAASTPLLRGAFRFSGEVAETGYPRNDVLVAPDREAVRARVRRELGIAPETTAVLYAPTFRDDTVFSPDGRPFALELDADRFADQLGDDHCLLLRLHYFLTDRLEAAARPGVRDVSFHPEISDLYLAADVLVTDYSSAMFDFAVTGKPIVFYAYDLAHYAGVLRGFYFDFATTVPGPLLETTQEVIDALRDMPAVTDSYRERYARFQERFCHLDDGHATRRVLERLGLAAEPAGRADSGAGAI